jgi:DNA polymerase-3 subunit delta'
VHPDLTWVTPSGAHEILVSDIDEPVSAPPARTPFESSRRVFVIERADELGDEAANRMLKTLEEPPRSCT